MQQIALTAKEVNRAKVQSVLLFTDGLATRGITDHAGILKEMRLLQTQGIGSVQMPKASDDLMSSMLTHSGIRKSSVLVQRAFYGSLIREQWASQSITLTLQQLNQKYKMDSQIHHLDSNPYNAHPNFFPHFTGLSPDNLIIPQPGPKILHRPQFLRVFGIYGIQKAKIFSHYRSKDMLHLYQ